MRKKILASFGILAAFYLALLVCPNPLQSVFAQQVSPFTAPNYTTSQLPGTCANGTMIYDSTTSGTGFCSGNSFVAHVFGNLFGSPPATGTLAQWVGGWQLQNTGVAYNNIAPAASALVQTGVLGYFDEKFLPPTLTTTCTNGSGGTLSAGTLVKLNSSGQCVAAATTDTATQVYIVFAGATAGGTLYLTSGGTVQCTMDASGGAVLHYAVPSSTTAGRCADGGSTPPGGYFVLGQLQQTVSANASAFLAVAAGYLANAGGGGGVSSVGLSLPASLFTVSGPVTSTGTLTGSFINASDGNFLGGPCTGASAAPTLRALCAADLGGITWINSAGNISGSITNNYSTNASSFYKATLTGNVTSFAVSNATTGQWYVFQLIQDGTGGRTVTFSGFHGAPTIDSSATASTAATFACVATGSTVMYCIPGIVNAS